MMRDVKIIEITSVEQAEAGGSWETPEEIDPAFDMKGHGMLDRFKKLNKRSDEEVKMGLVRFQSHPNFTFHEPVPAGFDRGDVLPPDQMKGLRDLGDRLLKERQLREYLNREKN